MGKTAAYVQGSAVKGLSEAGLAERPDKGRAGGSRQRDKTSRYTDKSNITI